MISATSKQPVLNPTPLSHEANGDQTHEKMVPCAAELPGALEQRLRVLDHEWDMERLTATTSGLVLLGGVLLVLFLGTAWLVLPVAIAACLLLYGVTGWRPAAPLARLLGFRTAKEIAFERYTLKASRGESQDREDLSRFESEGGSLAPTAKPDECFGGKPYEA